MKGYRVYNSIKQLKDMVLSEPPWRHSFKSIAGQ